MSWGPITATDSADSIEAALKGAYAAYAEQLETVEDYALKPQAVEQIEGAIEAAVAVVSVVAPDQSVTITLSGHANPDHVPTAGWGNDFVMMSVANAAQVGADPE